MRVDLAQGIATTAAGERDLLSAVEDVHGGAGPDVIAGDAGPNRLDGDRGDDLLLGRGGADELGSFERSFDFRPGRDVVHGGAGDDWLDSMRPASTCGPGRDRARATSPFNPDKARDCERLILEAGDVAMHRVLVTRTAVLLRMRVACPAEETDYIIRAGWRSPRPVLGQVARTGLSYGASVTIRIRLNSRGRRAIAGGLRRASVQTSCSGASHGHAADQPAPVWLHRVASRRLAAP